MTLLITIWTTLGMTIGLTNQIWRKGKLPLILLTLLSYNIQAQCYEGEDNPYDYVEICYQATDWQKFQDKLLVVAHKLNNKHSITSEDVILYDWLRTIIYVESKYDHQAINKKSGAEGLIQWLPRFYGEVPKDSLAQLDMVYEYFDMWIVRKGVPNSKVDMYLLVLYPRAFNSEWKVFSKGSTAYDQNKGLDVNSDGIVSAYEISKFLKR